MCVRIVALVIRHAKRMRRVVLSSVACQALQYFVHYLTDGTIFGKGLLNVKMCVLIFYTILPETCLILRRTERDIVIICMGLYVK
jgi:hypothetical protein